MDGGGNIPFYIEQQPGPSGIRPVSPDMDEWYTSRSLSPPLSVTSPILARIAQYKSPIRKRCKKAEQERAVAKEELMKCEFFDEGELQQLRLMADDDSEYSGVYRLEYQTLMQSNSILPLSTFIKDNFLKIMWSYYLEDKFLQFIRECATPELKKVLEEEHNRATMIRIIGVILQDYLQLKKHIQENCPPDKTQMEIQLEKKKQCIRLNKEIINYTATINQKRKEIKQMKLEAALTEDIMAELHAANNIILDMQTRQAFADPYFQEDLVPELQYQLHAHNFLNSSLQWEVQQERDAKEAVLKKYIESQAMKLNDQNQQMIEIGETVKYIKLHDELRDRIVERIQSLSPNLSDVKTAVNEWIEMLDMEVESKKNDVEMWKEEVKTMEDRVKPLERERQYLKGEIRIMNELIENRRQEIVNKEQQFREALAARAIAERKKESKKGIFKRVLESRAQLQPPKKPSTTPKWMSKVPLFSSYTRARPLATLPVLSSRVRPPTPIERKQGATGGASQAGFKETVYLKSPRGQDPVVLNIAVDPKPLTDTVNGEVFTCDVSLDLQRGQQGAIPKLSRASPRRITLPAKLKVLKRPPWRL